MSETCEYCGLPEHDFESCVNAVQHVVNRAEQAEAELDDLKDKLMERSMEISGKWLVKLNSVEEEKQKAEAERDEARAEVERLEGKLTSLVCSKCDSERLMTETTYKCMDCGSDTGKVQQGGEGCV